jgi:small-conductance mechanosensitive channel
MSFLFRLVTSVFLGIAVVVVAAALLLLIIWLVNRGLQLFCGLVGYEIGDFFGWIVDGLAKRLRLRRKRRAKPTPEQ